MNIAERKHVLFRIIASIGLLLSVAVVIFGMIMIVGSTSQDKTLAMFACGLAGAFTLLEMVVILKGWKKDISLYKIAFNDNGHVNNVFAIAVGVATALGLALSITSFTLFIINKAEPFTTSCLVILSIGFFLLINCLIYYIFIIMFRKRELKIEDFAK